MKVLFISNDPLLFVEGSAVRARMQQYAAAIGELHILSRHTENVDISDGALTLHGRNKDKVTGWRALAQIGKELIGTHQIELVSAQDPFEYGYVAMKAVEGTSAKLHIQIHTDFLSPWFTRPGIFRSPQVIMPLKNALRRKIARRVLPKAHGIRVVSERIRESLQVVYGDSIVTPTILPIVPTLTVPPIVPFPVSTTPFTILTIGRLEPEKRIEDILVALASIADRYPAISLIVIGDGRERGRLEGKAEELKIASRVHFLGSRKDAWGLMRSSQGYIQASAYEGYGMTLVEAALARVPIITSDVGVVGEVFKGYDDVLVSPPGDPVNLAYQIIALIEDVSNKEVRVRSAEHRAIEHVSRYENLPQLMASDLRSVL